MNALPNPSIGEGHMAKMLGKPRQYWRVRRDTWSRTSFPVRFNRGACAANPTRSGGTKIIVAR